MDSNDKLAKLQQKRDRLNAQIKAEKAKQSAKARKARTRELIQFGAIVTSHLDMPLNEETRTALNNALSTRFQDGTTLGTRLRDRVQEEINKKANPWQTTGAPDEPHQL